MTKQEYEQAMKIASEEWDMDSTDSAMVSDWTKPKDQYIFALEKRITELEKQIVVWHKYPDEKPPISNTYLVMLKEDDQPTTIFWDTNERYDLYFQTMVTHWAYLPEPPREEK